MHKPIKQLTYSIVDQASVSAGNFLTIALGANLLSLADQGKLVYVYAIYVAVILFNISVFFSSANTVKNGLQSTECYQHLLLAYQLVSAVLISFLISVFLLFFHHKFNWQPSVEEYIYLFLFIVLQQIADYARRAGYIFNSIKFSTLSSFWLYGARILMILYFQPDNLSDFLLFLLLPTLPIVLFELTEYLRGCRLSCDEATRRKLIHIHFTLSKWSICNTPFKWAGLHSPILLVGALHSLQAAAILGSIRAITNFANVLLELLETFAPTWLASRVKHGHHVLRKSSLNLLYAGMVGWLLGLFVIWMFGEAVIAYALGRNYAEYASILYVIWIGNGIFFIGRVIGLHYRTKENTFLELMGSLSGGVGLLATIPLMASYGVWGGAWAFVIIQAFTLLGIQAYRLRRV